MLGQCQHSRCDERWLERIATAIVLRNYIHIASRIWKKLFHSIVIIIDQIMSIDEIDNVTSNDSGLRTELAGIKPPDAGAERLCVGVDSDIMKALQMA